MRSSHIVTLRINGTDDIKIFVEQGVDEWVNNLSSNRLKIMEIVKSIFNDYDDGEEYPIEVVRVEDSEKFNWVDESEFDDDNFGQMVMFTGVYRWNK